jgi:hypothetical protein
MSSYRCKIFKHLWKTAEMGDHFVRLSKEIEIPFIPAAGIELREGNWYCGQIERVIWNNDEQKFTLVEVGDVADEGDVDALVDHHISLGWEIAHKNT